MTLKGFFISPCFTPDAMTIPCIRPGPHRAAPPARPRIPAAHPSSRQARTPRPPGSEKLLAAKGDPSPHHHLHFHNATAMSCHTLLFRGFADAPSDGTGTLLPSLEVNRCCARIVWRRKSPSERLARPRESPSGRPPSSPPP